MTDLGTGYEEEPLEPTTPDLTEEFLGALSDPPPDTFVPPPETEFIPDLGTESPFEDATQLVGDGTCVVCGAPTFRPPGLTKAGRKKRVPRYCDMHAPNARIPTDGPSVAGLESQLQRMQDELADDLRLLGTLAGPVFPITGYYLFTNADPFTIALLKLVKNNQRFLRVLYRASQVAPIYTIAKTGAGVARSIQIDQMPEQEQKDAAAHDVIGKSLGIDRAYEAVYPGARFNGNYPGFTSAPPRYATAP